MSSLSLKQIKFVDAYMISANATEAAKLAGYSEKTAQEQGSRLLSNVIIKDEIARRATLGTAKAIVTRDEIIADLKAIKDECKAKGEFPPYALKAIEILNKMLGYNEAEKVDHTSGGAPINFNYIKPKKDDK